MKTAYLLSFVFGVFILSGIFLSTINDAQEATIEVGGPLTIEEQLDGKTAEEKANIKSDEIVKIGAVVKQTVQFSNAEFQIEIIDIQKIDGGVSVLAKAWMPDGTQIGFGKDGSVEIERFNIHNPPILVNDEITGEITRTGTFDGETVTHKLRESPTEAILNTVTHAIKIKEEKSTTSVITKGKIGNTTSTFFPSMDEIVAEFGAADVTWTTLRDAAGNFHETNINSSVKFEFGATTDTYEEMHRHHSHHDATAIPDTDAIDSATWSFWIDQLTDQANGSSSANSAAVLVESTSDSTPANSDYQSFGTTEFGRTGAMNTLSTGAYTDLSLNSSGISFIEVVSGDTKLGLKHGWDFDDLEPHNNGATFGSGDEIRIRFFMADQTGTDNDSKLVVEHSPPSAGRVLRIDNGTLRINNGSQVIQ